ncbi:AI-2E family transporter [Plasticicumulans acidivorans]|uniref:Putative permease n=1 Tax=Plasticicumulans acidivorans TaxID=886464 RepID=A0A317MVI4_9GAMM|nr:AI-2E family transporter [Plasticicumulans acidivorans]PWV58515.1 putative permease [Plasticicumulans acidivorans]
MKLVTDWFRRVFNDAQTVSLLLLIAAVLGIVLFFGRMLAPVLAGIVMAYLLEGVVRVLERHGTARWPSVLIVFLSFIASVVFVLTGPLPMLSRQASELAQQLPEMVLRGQQYLMSLPVLYPRFVDESQVLGVIGIIKGEVGGLAQNVFTWSLASVFGVITILVYLILVPVLVFFFLKDKERILGWAEQFLPTNRGLVMRVWRDIDLQIGNYVRGKIWEVLLNWLVCYLVFAWLDLQYAMLLSFMVGLSVIVPYLGAVVVTVPVAVVGLFQWGWGTDFLWLIGAYAILMALDGNVLVPWLFSEVVDLHPVAIIVAVLLFGGLWGFWGVFFAIPLATVVQAVLKAWPRRIATPPS